jgi:hypothetical protein
MTNRKNISLLHILIAFGFLLTLSGCYSFTGANFDPSIQTYWVAPFRDNADNAPAALSTDFTEALKEKIRTQSRLTLTEDNPQIEFRGTLVDYRITAEAPQPGERTSLSRLTIVTAVEYINNLDEEDNWKSNFSFFYDFPSNQDFSSIEEEATQTIIDQIMEDIFNRAFTDW